MAPELAARAFEGASPEVTRPLAPGGSTGPGLSIAEAIVAAHDGTVALRSTPGHGTSVTAHLRRLDPRRSG